MQAARLSLIVSQSLIFLRANLKARYRQSFAGFLWVFIGPLSTYLAQAYVFRFVFKIQVQNYFSFLLFGLVPWIFFSQTLEMTTTSFYNQNRILKSLNIHPLSLIIAQALDNLINSIVLIFVVLLALTIFFSVPWERLFLFPIAYTALALTGISFGFVLAVTNIFFYDTKFVLTFALGLLFFVSPVFYPESFVPDEFRWVLLVNPLTYLLRPFRALLDQGPGVAFLEAQLQALGICLIAIGMAYLVWQRKKHVFYFKL